MSKSPEQMILEAAKNGLDTSVAASLLVGIKRAEGPMIVCKSADHYPGIKRACLAITYANGGINRHRPETQVLHLMGLWLGENFHRRDLKRIDAWLAAKTDAEIEILADGEESESKALLVGSPPETDELLEDYFENVC
ncbi:hypothetical protein EV128_1254 [Rhizobium azibense]|nr:hypothetical protein EV128_1254 [Rhizobium azibense]